MNSLLLFFLCCAAITTAQTQCGQFQCSNTDQCCNDIRLSSVCFNPLTHHCVDNKVLCALNEGECGGWCYNITTATCLNNGTSEFQCGKGLLACGTLNICYNPNLFTCSGNDIVPKPVVFTCGSTNCNATQECCDSQCFDPMTSVCAKDDLGNMLVCPINSLGKAFSACRLSSGSVCYDRDNLTCCSNTLCLIGDDACCGLAVQQTSVLASLPNSGSSEQQTSAETQSSSQESSSSQEMTQASSQATQNVQSSSSQQSSFSTQQSSSQAVIPTQTQSPQLTDAIVPRPPPQQQQKTSNGVRFALSIIVLCVSAALLL